MNSNIALDNSQTTLVYLGYLLTIFGVSLTLMMLGAALVLIVLHLINQFQHGDDAIYKNDTYHWSKSILGVFVCSGFLSLLFATCILFLLSFVLPSNSLYGWSISYFFTNPDHASIIDRISDFAIGLTGPTMTSPWRIFIFLTPFITGISYVFNRSSQNESQQQSTRRKLQKSAQLLLLLTAWGIFLLTTDFDTAQIIGASFAGIFLLASFIKMWRRSTQHSITNASHSLKSILASWICIASVLILIVMIGQTALDNHLQPWANTQLYGQMHSLHHVAESPPERP